MFRTSQGLQMQKKSGLFRKIECIRGKEITDWLLKHQRATVLSEAKMICQCFLHEKYLEPVVVRSTTFVEFQPDETLYKLGKVSFKAIHIPTVDSICLARTRTSKTHRNQSFSK